MAKAVIENGVVVNIIVADEDFQPAGVTLVTATALTQIGGGWDGSVFTPRPPETIEEERARMVATLAQIRIALAEAGKLTAFENLVNADTRAAVIWQYGGEVRRDSTLVAKATGGAVTDEVIDTIFRAAMLVKV